MQERTEFEREMLATARLVRRVIYGGGIALGGMLLLSVLSALLVARTSGGSSSGAGTDVHGALTNSATVETKTESGSTVRATLTNLAWSQQGEDQPRAPVLTVRIHGGEPESLAADAWTFVLTDGTVLALKQFADSQPSTYRVWLEGALPPGSAVRFVHFNPDSSHGDIYFDVKK